MSQAWPAFLMAAMTLAASAGAQSSTACPPYDAAADARPAVAARCDSVPRVPRRDALRRNSLTLGGLPGLVNVPVAGSVPAGMVDFALNTERTPSLVPNLGTQRNAFLTFGFLPRVTIGARSMVAEDTLAHYKIRDLGAHVQVLVADQGRWTPAIAVGEQDVGGANSYFHAIYAVASRTFFDHARATVGYGSGPVRLNGVIGGIETDVGPWATAMGEYDGEQYAWGVRAFPFPALAERAGLQPKLDLTWRQHTGFALAGGIRMSLSGPPGPREDRIVRTDSVRRDVTRDVEQSGAIVPAPRAVTPTPARETGIDVVRRELVAQGFENVRVARAPGPDAAAIDVEYENRRFNRDELDALGIVMGITTAYAPATFTRMRITIRRVDIAVLTITCGIGAFADFANNLLDEAAFAGQLGFDAPSRAAGSADAEPAANSSRFKLDVFVRPRVETVFLSDFGVFETRVAALPDAYIQLGRGLVLNGRWAIPVTQSSGFPTALEDPNGDRLLLHQAFSLRLGAARSAWRALTQFSIGRFGHDEVGVADEVAVSLPSGLVSFGGTLGIIGPTFGGLNRAVALGVAKVRDPALDLTASLTAGRFRNGDAGVAGDVSRLFGDTELGFYIRTTEFQSEAGVRIALPLTPARELPPARIRPRLPDVHSQEMYYTVFGGLPVLRRDVALPLATDHEVGRIYWDRDRLQPVTVRSHVRTLRVAVRRWAGWGILVDRTHPEN